MAGGLLLAAGPALLAQDPPPCDATTLTGAYSVSLKGNYYDSTGNWYFYTLVGLYTFDGAGNLTGTDTVSYDGTVTKRKTTGTYTVNTDCTATIATTGSDKITQKGDMVVKKKGAEIDFIDTDTDIIVSGTINKQNP